jgi:hypothetical protein
VLPSQCGFWLIAQDVYGQEALPQEHQLALSVLTIIGLSLSIAGLAITVLSFILIKSVTAFGVHLIKTDSVYVVCVVSD